MPLAFRFPQLYGGGSMTKENMRKFNELMARVGYVEDGICPKCGRVKMTIRYENRGVIINDHHFYGICESKHEWQIAQFYNGDL
jgi:hypothetical protein